MQVYKLATNSLSFFKIDALFATEDQGRFFFWVYCMYIIQSFVDSQNILFIFIAYICRNARITYL